MKFIALILIRIYQWTISPLLGDVCRFEVSCSKYAYQVIEREGFMKGAWLAVKRIMKCNPWC